MMMGLGVGGVAVGMFHLITHAFFKALLFLGAGSVIHGCHEEQDIRCMGGLKRFMPITFATYAVGHAGVVRVSAVLLRLLEQGRDPARCTGLERLARAVLSREFWGTVDGFLYDAPGLLRVFRGTRLAGDPDVSCVDAASEARHLLPPHESPAVMTVPLVILAAFAILLGVIGTPAWPWFDSFLNGQAAVLNFGGSFEGGILRCDALFFDHRLCGLGLGLVVLWP